MNKKMKENIKLMQLLLEEIPEISYVGDPILRRKTSEVTVEEGRKIAKELESTLLKYREITGWGIGLAAPQIGKSKSVFITFVDDKIEVFMNPKIIEKSSESNFYKELCISSGVLSADVKRPKSVKMEWIDKNGKKHSEHFNGAKARLYQHEEAHLHGVLNLDEAISGGIEFISSDPREEELRNEA